MYLLHYRTCLIQHDPYSEGDDKEGPAPKESHAVLGEESAVCFHSLAVSVPIATLLRRCRSLQTLFEPFDFFTFQPLFLFFQNAAAVLILFSLGNDGLKKKTKQDNSIMDTWRMIIYV